MRSSHRRQAAVVLTELAQVAALALVVFLLLHFVLETVQVEGISMQQTLQDHDYLVATTIDYRLHPPARGDIVVVHGLGPVDLIKRVIGLPGERILIRSGVVYVNGRRLIEPYLGSRPWTINADWPAAANSTGEVIPPRYYFVMGDNRDDSRDSRSFGPIRVDQVDARAWFRVYPLKKLGPVDGQHPSLS